MEGLFRKAPPAFSPFLTFSALHAILNLALLHSAGGSVQPQKWGDTICEKST